VYDTTHELTQWDGKVAATLRTLFTRPGELTLDFLAGRRARWLLPLRLYLLCSVAFFVTGPLVDALDNEPDEDLVRVTIANPDGTKTTTLTPEQRQELEQGLPARVFGIERLERANPEHFSSVARTTYPRAMFVILPFFALLTNVLWRGKAPRYPAHLYAALHLHAAWFGVMTVAAVAALAPWVVLQGVIEVSALIYAMWYGVVAARRIFADSWPKTIAKSAAVAVVYGSVLLAVSLLMVAYALLTL
jgi:hypothetical protein